MRLLTFVTLTTIAAISCVKREDPPSLKLSANHTQGDGTVTGTPAAVGKFLAAPTIDGKLDDAAWESATTLGPFVDPGQGNEDMSALAGAWAKVGWDDKALYFAFFVRDTSPMAPFDKSETDPHLWEKSSAIEVMLQPGNPGDNRDYYEMQYDTKGAAFDTHWDDYNDPIVEAPTGKVFGHQEWSSKADRAAFVEQDRYYTLEVAIPWTSFVKGRTAIPPKAGDVWRLNLYAFRDSQRVSNAWSPIKGQGNFHKSSRWGTIQFK
jgi:Carbohydrate family 9 binding domain-like